MDFKFIILRNFLERKISVSTFHAKQISYGYVEI